MAYPWVGCYQKKGFGVASNHQYLKEYYHLDCCH